MLYLSEILDNVVVGQLGTLLAFPLSSFEDFPSESSDMAEKEYRVDGASEERIVSLPTPGLFVDSQMGQRTACEKIDDSRFWDRQQSPCPDEAPDITPEMLASRFQSPESLLQITRSDLEPKDVQFPQLPEPAITMAMRCSPSS